MQIAATNKRFLTGYSSIDLLAALQAGSRHGEFYQQLTQALIKGFHTKEAIIGLGQRLTALAQHAYTLRQMDNVEQASQILMNLPLAEYRNIGLYYYALAIKRRGQATQAETLLERVADDAPVRYRGQALLSLGAFAIARGNLESALTFYTEALRVASKKDFLIMVQTLKMVAVVKGMDGDHRGAVADLESLMPAVRTVSVYRPQFLFDHFNSLAVELGEVGRLEEAQNACRIVLASPYASAYPECRETWDDIQVRGYRASRSVVAFTRKNLNVENIARMPVREDDGGPGSSRFAPEYMEQPARVLSYMDWKKNMVKEPNGTPQDQERSKELSPREMLLRIMELTSEKDITDDELEEILRAVEKIRLKHKGKGKK
jgi:tetratricopeptide (TPR) repeat protein